MPKVLFLLKKKRKKDCCPRSAILIVSIISLNSYYFTSMAAARGTTERNYPNLKGIFIYNLFRYGSTLEIY